MAKETLRDRYVAALKSLGFIEAGTKSRKYVTLYHSAYHGRAYFIGKSGAVRVGPTSTKSIPISDAAKAMLLQTPPSLPGHTVK